MGGIVVVGVGVGVIGVGMGGIVVVGVGIGVTVVDIVVVGLVIQWLALWLLAW